MDYDSLWERNETSFEETTRYRGKYDRFHKENGIGGRGRGRSRRPREQGYYHKGGRGHVFDNRDIYEISRHDKSFELQKRADFETHRRNYILNDSSLNSNRDEDQNDSFYVSDNEHYVNGDRPHHSEDQRVSYKKSFDHSDKSDTYADDYQAYNRQDSFGNHPKRGQQYQPSRPFRVRSSCRGWSNERGRFNERGRSRGRGIRARGKYFPNSWGSDTPHTRDRYSDSGFRDFDKHSKNRFEDLDRDNYYKDREISLSYLSEYSKGNYDGYHHRYENRQEHVSDEIQNNRDPRDRFHGDWRESDYLNERDNSRIDQYIENERRKKEQEQQEEIGKSRYKDVLLEHLNVNKESDTPAVDMNIVNELVGNDMLKKLLERVSMLESEKTTIEKRIADSKDLPSDELLEARNMSSFDKSLKYEERSNSADEIEREISKKHKSGHFDDSYSSRKCCVYEDNFSSYNNSKKRHEDRFETSKSRHNSVSDFDNVRKEESQKLKSDKEVRKSIDRRRESIRREKKRESSKDHQKDYGSSESRGIHERRKKSKSSIEAMLLEAADQAVKSRIIPNINIPRVVPYNPGNVIPKNVNIHPRIVQMNGPSYFLPPGVRPPGPIVNLAAPVIHGPIPPPPSFQVITNAPLPKSQTANLNPIDLTNEITSVSSRETKKDRKKSSESRNQQFKKQSRKSLNDSNLSPLEKMINDAKKDSSYKKITLRRSSSSNILIKKNSEKIEATLKTESSQKEQFHADHKYRKRQGHKIKPWYDLKCRHYQKNRDNKFKSYMKMKRGKNGSAAEIEALRLRYRKAQNEYSDVLRQRKREFLNSCSDEELCSCILGDIVDKVVKFNKPEYMSMLCFINSRYKLNLTEIDNEIRKAEKKQNLDDNESNDEIDEENDINNINKDLDSTKNNDFGDPLESDGLIALDQIEYGNEDDAESHNVIDQDVSCTNNDIKPVLVDHETIENKTLTIIDSGSDEDNENETLNIIDIDNDRVSNEINDYVNNDIKDSKDDFIDIETKYFFEDEKLENYSETEVIDIRDDNEDTDTEHSDEERTHQYETSSIDFLPNENPSETIEIFDTDED